MQIAIKPNYLVDVMNAEFVIDTEEWWVRTSENLRVPNRFPWVVVMAVGKGKTLEEALKNAAAEHVRKVEERRKQEGLT